MDWQRGGRTPIVFDLKAAGEERGRKKNSASFGPERPTAGSMVWAIFVTDLPAGTFLPWACNIPVGKEAVIGIRHARRLRRHDFVGLGWPTGEFFGGAGGGNSGIMGSGFPAGRILLAPDGRLDVATGLGNYFLAAVLPAPPQAPRDRPGNVSSLPCPTKHCCSVNTQRGKSLFFFFFFFGLRPRIGLTVTRFCYGPGPGQMTSADYRPHHI